LPFRRSENDKKEGPEGVWCAAYKCWGYKSFALIDLSKKFRFVAGPFPGSPHDITRIRELKEHIKNNTDARAGIALDSGFMGFEREVSKGVWFVKKHSTAYFTLTAEDVLRNSKIEEVRRYIEFCFGDVKTRFRVVYEVFRHNRDWLFIFWRFCCVIHNIIIDYMHSPDTFSEAYAGPLPKLQPPIPKFRRKRRKTEEMWQEECPLNAINQLPLHKRQQEQKRA
jgi:hypothetical protein